MESRVIPSDIITVSGPIVLSGCKGIFSTLKYESVSTLIVCRHLQKDLWRDNRLTNTEALVSHSFVFR